MSVYPFLGMRGTGDWTDSDMRPKNWRQKIFQLYPNGAMPLTAIMSMLSEESTDDPQYYWWNQDFPSQGGDITAGEVYTNVGLSSAYASGGVAGQTVYVKMAEAVCKEFRAGHTAILLDQSDYSMTVIGIITTRVLAGASSYVGFKLIEADDNSYGAANTMANADRILIIGNANEEGAEMPDAIAYDPVKLYNYTQIFRTPLEITRTAKKTRLRTGDAYKKAKREALEMHGIEIEKAMIFGERYESTGDGGKPIRLTRGLLRSITTKSAMVTPGTYDFSAATAYSGKTWVESGEDWLDDMCEDLFKYGATERFGLSGSGAIKGINRLVKNLGQYVFTTQTKSYGIKVTEWVTPYGTIYLKSHPLFSHEASFNNTITLFEPKNLVYRYVDDTFFKRDDGERKGGQTNRDGTKDEYLTECGMEQHNEKAHMFLAGVGEDNAL